MKEINRIVIPSDGRKIQSLCWSNDELVDWVGGGHRYNLNGDIFRANVNYAYEFDYAVVSPDCQYSALLTRLGTKGLILKNGKIIREINRSFYQASVYEYPFTFMRLPGGEMAIAHCPNEYCEVEIEEVESGERLTTRSSAL